MLEETTVICPYCGEAITVLIDCSAGDTRYVEDCAVCCQPIELRVTVTADAGLQHVEAQPENG
jgi:transcription elongation factor Elf1